MRGISLILSIGTIVCLAIVALQALDGPATPGGAEPQTVPQPGPKSPAPAPLDGREGRDLALDQFRPTPMLKVEQHHLSRAGFPVVDVHVHPRLRLHGSRQLLDEYVKLMDAMNIAVSVSLDGGIGQQFVDHRDFLWASHRARWVIFANVDWRGDGDPKQPATWDCQRPDFADRTARLLDQAKQQGACGLKVFKDLGLAYRNPDGSLLRVDDRRWDPIWEACGKLAMPVLIHTADPPAFFQPIDATNERWEELKRHPEWSFGRDNPTYDALIKQFLNVVERHPHTTFIGAHVASSAEDLARVGRWLDAYPNLYVDIAARIGELGRQPYTARRFFLSHSDRILFGTDGPRVAERLAYHWRFLETFDEYFPYAENPFPPQGFWRIYGLGLPDEVLKKVYSGNALRIVPEMRERYDSYLRGRQIDPDQG